MMSSDDLDTKIASLEADLGMDLSALDANPGLNLGEEAPDASPPAEAAIPAREAAPPATDSHPQGESAAGTIREYLDERDRRIDLQRRVQEAEARMQQQRTPAYDPDPFMDPHGYANARINEQLQPIRNFIAQQAIRGQIGDAHAAHGVELVKKAADAFDAAAPTMHPIEAASVMQSGNPYLAAVDWMRRRDTQREVGTDPAAYRERIVAEAVRSNPTYARQVQEALRRAGRSFPSLNQNNHGIDGEADEQLIEKALRSKTNPWA
jgi:hypothetical protein